MEPAGVYLKRLCWRENICNFLERMWLESTGAPVTIAVKQITPNSIKQPLIVLVILWVRKSDRAEASWLISAP